MDIETKRALVRVRLEKAHDDLISANDLLKTGRWRGAVNRAYYTVFHFASAALVWIDIQRAKHSATLAAFVQYLIKPGLIEREYADLYAEARDWREEQDYKDFARPLDEKVATQIVQDAERFVARLERYLREVGAIE